MQLASGRPAAARPVSQVNVSSSGRGNPATVRHFAEDIIAQRTGQWSEDGIIAATGNDTEGSAKGIGNDNGDLEVDFKVALSGGFLVMVLWRQAWCQRQDRIFTFSMATELPRKHLLL